MSNEIFVKVADVADFPCDVLILKFAQAFHGVDDIIATKLSPNSRQDIQPSPGSYVLLPGNGRVAAKSVLFVGVVPLPHFDYAKIRAFATASLQIVREQMPNITNIAMTMHGVGYGLDEKESFLAQIAGIFDAFRSGETTRPSITIVDKNEARASRLRKILEENLPAELSSDEPKGAQQLPRLSPITAGRSSEEKPHVFVAMPFADEMEDVYIFGIQGPVNAAGFLCERVDMTTFTGDIVARMKSRIETAALVIADLTGANPNVYLEVGYAWGKDRSTLLLAKQSAELKFDVRGQRTLVYKSIADLAKKLEADLAALI